MKFLVSISCLILTACGAGGPPTVPFPTPDMVAPPSSPIPIASGESVAPFEFSKIEIGMPRNQVIGTAAQYMGNTRISISSELTYSGGGSRDREFNRTFVREVTSAGYKVVGDPDSLFQDPERSAAPYVVAGLVQDLKADVRAQARLTHGVLLGITTMRVRWEVYDRLERKVVYQTTTEGSARQESNQDFKVAFDEFVLAAFSNASRNLLADHGFHDQLTKKVSLPPAPASAGSRPAPLTIKFVPLATKRFQDQATDIRAHVATVYAGDGTGSGFFINDGYLLTNYHVVEKAKFVKVRLISGREIVGEVLGSDARRDVALVKTESVGLKGLPIRTSDANIGAQVFVIGSPLGPRNEGTVLSGIISTYRNIDGQPFIQSDVPVQHGNSGGPMVDENGNIIGLTEGGEPVNGVPVSVNIFIPIGDALKTLGVTVAAR